MVLQVERLLHFESPPPHIEREDKMNPETASKQHERRWLILAMVGVAQLMVVLDATIVNIALPSAQHSLGFSNGSRQWVVTAYALALGGPPLRGGGSGGGHV